MTTTAWILLTVGAVLVVAVGWWVRSMDRREDRYREDRCGWWDDFYDDE